MRLTRCLLRYRGGWELAAAGVSFTRSITHEGILETYLTFICLWDC